MPLTIHAHEQIGRIASGSINIPPLNKELTTLRANGEITEDQVHVIRQNGAKLMGDTIERVLSFEALCPTVDTVKAFMLNGILPTLEMIFHHQLSGITEKVKNDALTSPLYQQAFDELKQDIINSIKDN